MAHDEVLGEVRKMVHEILDDDAVEVTMDTSFGDDLELESIEFVALAEKLTAKFGKEIDFAGWLSGMELDRILALRVSDLVDHIHQCRS